MLTEESCFYEIAGAGENIVLLHDGMVDREVWDEQFPVLAKNYRVVRYDRRTYGKSSDPQAPYSDIEDLNQLFIELKIDQAIVFGMSSGGGLAIDFTLKYPVKVSALVLVGAVVSGYDIADVHAHSGVIEFGIPNAKREVIPKSGHLIPLEQPEAFYASVWRFLKRTEFFTALISRGVDAAVQYFKGMHASEPNIVLFEEMEINALGYRFLQDGRTRDAINLFKINTIAFPNSANVFDSLGEAYLKDGQNDLAIINYKKSLELNPNNENDGKVLKELNEKK